jgi:positive control factor
MLDLIVQYKQALKDVRKLQVSASAEDKKLLGGMASDLEYAIQWMQTGRKPGNKRGIERRAAYEREKPFDPLLMQRYFRSMDDNSYTWDTHKQEDTVSVWDRERIDDALSVLTAREKEIYLMKRGQCLTYEQIATYYSISRGSVQDSIKRSEKKIKKQLQESLCCFCG